MEKLENSLEQVIYHEQAVAELLGVDIKRLAYLRSEKGLPCIKISRMARIYLAQDILAWLVRQR